MEKDNYVDIDCGVKDELYALIKETTKEVNKILFNKTDGLKSSKELVDFLFGVTVNTLGNVALRVYVPDPQDLKDADKIAQVNIHVVNHIFAWFKMVSDYHQKQGMN